MEKAFREFIAQINEGIPLSKAFLEQLKNHIRLLEYQKNDTWLVKGTSSREVLYIQHGSAMSYRQTEAHQWITSLWTTNEMIIQGSSLLPRPDPKDRIVFLEASTVLAINIEKAQTLQIAHPSAIQLINRILIKSLQRLEDQYRLMHFQPPKTRLHHTQQHYKKTFHLLTSEQKASYLGISRPTLYRLLH